MNNVSLRAEKERIWYWDTIKFLMMLTVVVGHFAETAVAWGGQDIAPLHLFIYAFHMPMFIFIF